VARLIVYGSRARGDAAEDSDLDVLALVTPDQPDIETRLEDIAYAVMWDFDFQPLLSLKVMPETRFRAALEKGHSFQRHVMAEGVVV
jgi:predicted nucleotidyltransferase